MNYYIGDIPASDYLMHYGIKGMGWGRRRYQNPDGSLTMAGKARYNRYRTKYNRYNTLSKMHGMASNQASSSFGRKIHGAQSARYSKLASNAKIKMGNKTGQEYGDGYVTRLRSTYDYNKKHRNALTGAMAANRVIRQAGRNLKYGSEGEKYVKSRKEHNAREGMRRAVNAATFLSVAPTAGIGLGIGMRNFSNSLSKVGSIKKDISYIKQKNQMMLDTGREKALKGKYQRTAADEYSYGKKGAARIAKRRNKGMSERRAKLAENVRVGAKTLAGTALAADSKGRISSRQEGSFPGH